ncbi:MAG: decarboxylase [Cyanobacteria bacterium SZAS-4]|nr:decarboxylase [Cyanobacteria bacterium SZAS-4]
MNASKKLFERFFFPLGARCDRWSKLVSVTSQWGSGSKTRAEVDSALTDLHELETFHGYPGMETIATLADLVESGEPARAAALATHYYRELTSNTMGQPVDGLDSDGSILTGKIAGSEHMITRSSAPGRRSDHPYFEVLVVSDTNQFQGRAISQELARLSNNRDPFSYSTVVVDNFFDAFSAALLNPALAAVIISDGFVFSNHESPLLNKLTERLKNTDAYDLLGLREISEQPQEQLTLRLSQTLRKVRPELDLYLLLDQRVEEIAGKAEGVRRVFYSLEETRELHYAILEGVAKRYSTPFFDKLKQYSQRPIATFHALPIARGKSIFKSHWIQDMGEFYGTNLFLAESSATTGGLDSLLEPTGTIKEAQEMAARAFGAEHAFFVTNGTSTSNKMVLQALLAPGDIAIVDRNCHKSHHYGMVLSGVFPLYLDAFPIEPYSMYGGVPLHSIKKALLDLKREGKLDRVRMVDLTNCTFDGHIYNTRRVMEECLAIKPDLIFLWDEAWFGFARFSPFFRSRTAMGAAQELETWFRDQKSIDRYEEQQKQLGANPTDEDLLKTRLFPDPRRVRLRVYQTHSTHKSMSALRQGSMVLVRDVDFEDVEEQFKEAVYTHCSTSPNQNLIASLDIARRQMELEGYGLVANAVEVALTIRREIENHPEIGKYFPVLKGDHMVPEEFRKSGLDYLSPDTNWADALQSLEEDEFCLDPTRMTMVCGEAGFDGTEFKQMLAEHNIQVNKTSRNTVLLQANINNTRSDVAALILTLLQISTEINNRHSRDAFETRKDSLMNDVPKLPNFSRFHNSFRKDAKSQTSEGDIRNAFYAAQTGSGFEYYKLQDSAIDDLLKSGRELVAANFVIPYPPGFPLLVPGQVITAEIMDFMRKLDVSEIHGYNAKRGLKVFSEAQLAL